MKNNLIVIENGQLNTYMLDTRVTWEVGRLSKDNTPDIAMHTTTVSRRQGKFQNMDGIWFYMDYNPINRTFRNGRKLTAGLNGRVRPVMVSDGDSFMFGGGDEPVVCPGTVWAFFSENYYDSPWRAVATAGFDRLVVIDGEDSGRKYQLDDLHPGKVFACPQGMAIYMGDVTYLTGKLKLMGAKRR